MTDKVSCPWCPWFIDLSVSPMNERQAERKLENHKRNCPNRKSQSHPRDHTDVHGRGPFEDNSNV